MKNKTERYATILRWTSLVICTLYAGSNVHFVASDQVAMVVRLGALVDSGTPQAVHNAGFLWAYPKPIDEVVLLSTQRYESLEISDVSLRSRKDSIDLAFLQNRKDFSGFHPESFGYVVTGDHNIVHMSFLVQYRITEPQIIFAVRDIKTLLHRIVLQSIIEQAGKTTIDSLLTDGLYDFIKSSRDNAQIKMDAIVVGIEISTIEVVQKNVPKQVRNDFEKVQSTYIDAQTVIQEAMQYREEKIPAAKSQRNQSQIRAKSNALEITSDATSEVQKFMSVHEEYERNAVVVRERLYREGIEKIMRNTGATHFIPPPMDEKYPPDFHIEIGKEP